jgi:hypothetical protein
VCVNSSDPVGSGLAAVGSQYFEVLKLCCSSLVITNTPLLHAKVQQE